MTEQHDDHCLIVANGVKWRIAMIHPGLIIVVLNADTPIIGSVLDLSETRWDEYTEAAVSYLEAYWSFKCGT